MRLIQLQLLCICIYLTFTQNTIQYYGSCYTPLRANGICVSLQHCPEVVTLFQKLPQNEAREYSTILQRICKFQITTNRYPIVCCQTPTTMMLDRDSDSNLNIQNTTKSNKTIRTKTIGDTCRDPELENGICQPLKNCPILLDRLRNNPEDQLFQAYLRSSNKLCDSVDTNVCCPIQTVNQEAEQTTQINRYNGRSVKVIFPTESEGCGATTQNFLKVVGGEESSIGAWPWIALLGYNVRSASPFRCGGTLVTAKHVITAAHCILRDLTFVRLGEFDLINQTETQHIDINIIKMNQHPNFRQAPDKRFDIGILLLEHPVEFSSTICPICMPSSQDLRIKSYVGYTPFIAGWGRTSQSGSSSNVLKHAQIPILNNTVCHRAFELRGALRTPQQFDESVLCAGVLVGEIDTCQGDSGGPMMVPELYKGLTRYYLIGVVSYGIGCAQGVPGVYTSTQFFYDWITEQISQM